MYLSEIMSEGYHAIYKQELCAGGSRQSVSIGMQQPQEASVFACTIGTRRKHQTDFCFKRGSAPQKGHQSFVGYHEDEKSKLLPLHTLEYIC